MRERPMKRGPAPGRPVVLGGASGFWGEAAHATAELLEHPGLDALVYDHLAEITLSIMARARAADPAAGHAADFVTEAMVPNLRAIAGRGVKVLSNAGGMNPPACADQLRRAIAAAGLDLRVAVIEGDDLAPRIADFAGAREMETGAAFPPLGTIASANAYLGAFPVAEALARGADIVLTGRCADSALALGAAIHAHGWGPGDHDLLAAGALAGHLIECGPQATGGNFTDWRAAGDLARIGYPLAAIHADGTVEITKPEGSSGCVTPAAVAEQMLYEIGDPRAYLLPDVICDVSEVAIAQAGPDVVRLSGARGRPPTGRLKVSATFRDGYRAGHVLQFAGHEARAKAEAFARIGLDRAQARLRAMGAAEFREILVEIFGGRPGPGAFEEITLKIAVRHDDAPAVALLLREVTGAALATPPGLHFFTGAGRPRPSEVLRLFSFLVDAAAVPVTLTLDDGPPVSVTGPEAPAEAPAPPAPHRPPDVAPDTGPGAETRPVRLERLAWARSGDKGDAANIGVIARHPALMPWIWAGLSPDRIAEVFAGEVTGGIARHYLPGIHAMNIVMGGALGGGGVASLRSDPQGKAFAQRLLDVGIALPPDLLRHAGGATDGV